MARIKGRQIGLADQLRNAIALSGLSVSELARQAEIDRAQVLRFLSRERDIRLETAGLLCDALGLQLTETGRRRGRPSIAKTERTDSSQMAVKPPIADEGEPDN